tara:strand:+ start:363 stop:740 length:378 start_codon:yes stop_codon:yes gene_type:complete
MKMTTGIIGTLCVATAWLMTACQGPDPSSFAQVHHGMSQSQVIKLLGEPSSRWEPRPPLNGEPAPDWSARWQYGDTLSSTASTAIGPDIAPDSVWVIVFDQAGTVMDYRPPIETDDAFPMRKPPK